MTAETQAIPPVIRKKSYSLEFFVVVVLGAAMLGGCAVIYFFNPSTHGFYPTCMFHEMTGLNCPGCGATRAVYALLHGRILTALRDNSLFILSGAILTIMNVRFVWRTMRGQPAEFNLPAGFLWTFLVVAIVFTILRNLPEFSFLSP
jgi:Protein of unknown function (DUF2752)